MELGVGTLEFIERVYGRQGNRELIENRGKYLEFLKKQELDEKAISAALLYDLGLEEVKKEFDKEVLDLINGLRRFNLLAVKAGKRNKEDKIRKMLIATTEDLRILLVKLLERLYEMENLEGLEEIERKRISRDTIEIYAPMAYRLGLSELKWQLEDLAFKHLNFRRYNELKGRVGLKREERERIVEELKERLSQEIKKIKIKHEIFGRPKHLYSIHKKMINKNKAFEDIYDLLGLRVIVENSEECYKILGIVNSLWDPIPGRLKDFIISPRVGIYQSLHTGFYYKDIPVEIQIRTRKMNDIAEEGIAAHWKYKGLIGEKKFDKQLSWLRQILSFGTESDKEFLYKLKLDLFENNIFCFTPKGDIIELDEGSTTVDFAYAVHTDIGDKCTGARVNGKFVSLRQKLENGDEVEIITSNIHKPSRDWLGFVKTNKALEKIRQSLRIRGGVAGRRKTVLEEKTSESFIGVDGNYEIKIAKCCNPLPEEEIIGVVSSFKIVNIHSRKCENVGNIKNTIGAFWLKRFTSQIRINILAEDRLGIFAEVLNAIAAMGINIQTARAQSASEEVAQCLLDINFTSLKELREIIERIQKIQGIRRIRIE